MTLTATKAQDVSLGPPFALSIYGDNCSGKTHLALTCPGSKIVIDYQANLEVARKFPNEQIEVISNPPLRFNEMQAMWSDPIFDSFDVVILDNLTGMYRVVLEEIVKYVPLGGKDSKRPSPEAPILRDYGMASERLRYILSGLKDLGKRKQKTVIAITHVRCDTDKEGNKIAGYPNVPGQVPAYLLSLFPEQIYLRCLSGGTREAHLTNFDIYLGGTRILEKLKFVNPNLAEMYFSENSKKGE